MILDILTTAAPGILAAMGALASELAGAMALFLEGIINLGGFLCFSFSVFTGNTTIGTTLSVGCCTLFITLVALFVEKTRANVFLAGAAVNLFSAGIISILSAVWFGTNGVIADSNSFSVSPFIRTETTVAAWGIVLVFAFVIQRTTWGLSLRITGTAANMLYVNGISASVRRVQSWTVSGAFAAAAGCILVLRLQSYVPNISSGRGWIALAAVFLGRKTSIGVILAATVFAAADYVASQLVPSAALLSIPYLTALVLFLLLPTPQQKDSF